MQNRFDKINDLLVNYSLGNFDFKVEISPNLDEIDAIISGINMLGEELKVTTISNNYFNDIFHSLYDMVFVLSEDGIIKKVNNAAIQKLQLKTNDLIDSHMEVLSSDRRSSYFNKSLISKLIKGTKPEIETNLKSVSGLALPVLCTCSRLTNIEGENLGYVFVAKDISKQREAENQVVLAIIDTQENERERMARDLHDSLGQQLSAIKFYLGALSDANDFNHDKKLQILKKSNEAVTQVMSELRAICFNLMPDSLMDHGLKQALTELCNKIRIKEVLDFKVVYKKGTPNLEKSLEIAIFRIIQEFINNSIKHANAKNIEISVGIQNKFLKIDLEDDGIGFNYSDSYISRGFGLKNIRSRVFSYKGTLNIHSKPGEGTLFNIEIPLKNLKK